MSVTVTIQAPKLDAEAKRARAIRARELLDGASWVFDEYISECVRDLLATPSDGSGQSKREDLYRRSVIATDLKAHLLVLVQNQEAEDTQNERRTGSS